MPVRKAEPASPAELLEPYNFIMGIEDNFLENEVNVLFDRGGLLRDSDPVKVDGILARAYSDITCGLR